MLSRAGLRAGTQYAPLTCTEYIKHLDSPLTYCLVNKEEIQSQLELSLTLSCSLLENPKFCYWDPDEKDLIVWDFSGSCPKGYPSYAKPDSERIATMTHCRVCVGDSMTTILCRKHFQYIPFVPTHKLPGLQCCHGICHGICPVTVNKFHY